MLVALVFALLSCSHEEGSRPEIKKDKLVDVLVDVHLTEGYLTYSGSHVDRNRDRVEGAYNYVFRKHTITPQQFSNTMKYYSRHVDEYEQLYNKVIERITLYETDNLKNDTVVSPQRSDVPKRKIKHIK